MSDEGPPPMRRLTPDEMLGETPGIGPEVWNNPGLGDDVGGAFGDGQPRTPNPTSAPITSDVFTAHMNGTAGVHANGQTVPPQPSRRPPPPPPPPPMTPAPPPMTPATPPSAPAGLGGFWRKEWTPLAVVGGIVAFYYWYSNRKG